MFQLKKETANEKVKEWENDFLKGWWSEFVKGLLLTKDLTLRVFATKMIEEPLTPENLRKFLKLMRPKEQKLVADREYYVSTIKPNLDKILENQKAIILKQFEELDKIFKKYNETGFW